MQFLLALLFLSLPIKEEILQMHDADQALRSHWIKEKDDEIVKEILALDEKNQERLLEIVEEMGWPGSDLIGEAGTHAFWLLVQHSPDVAFQNRCLPLLKKATGQGFAELKDFAFLQDRVLIRMGEPQIYGTQTVIVDGQVIFYPIQEEEDVEVRRFEMGLNTLWEQGCDIVKMYDLRNESEQSSP